MAICSKCKKILWLIPKHELPDGTILCEICYDEFLEREKKAFLQNLAKGIFKRVPSNIVNNFIDKYGVNQDKEALDNFHLLLKKKYKDIVNDVISHDDIKNCLPYITEKIEMERKLRKFENDLKYHKEKNFSCSICKNEITRRAFDYSINVFEKPLCRKHQAEMKATINSKKLYYALKERGIECELEASDGHKHVDISIPKAKMYIEIDGSQHSANPEQFQTDIKRDNYSHKNGFVTKRYY